MIPVRPDGPSRYTDYAFSTQVIAVETDESGPLDITDILMNAAIRDEPGARDLMRDFFEASYAERRAVFLEWIKEDEDVS